MKKQSAQFLNIIINIIIPTIILVRFSSDQYLGPTWGLVVALAFPLLYGIYEYRQSQEANIFSIIGIISVFLTGGIGLLQIPAQWLAIKEAGVPLVLGLLIILFKTKYPFVEKLLHEVMDYRFIHALVEQENKMPLLHRKINHATYLVAASFFLSATLNYILARLIVTAAPGTTEFTQQLGTLTAVSYPVIALPSLIVLMAAMLYLLYGISKITGIELEKLISPQQPSTQPEKREQKMPDTK